MLRGKTFWYVLNQNLIESALLIGRNLFFSRGGDRRFTSAPLLSVENYVPLPVLASRPLLSVLSELRSSPGVSFQASQGSLLRTSCLNRWWLRSLSFQSTANSVPLPVLSFAASQGSLLRYVVPRVRFKGWSSGLLVSVRTRSTSI